MTTDVTTTAVQKRASKGTLSWSRLSGSTGIGPAASLLAGSTGCGRISVSSAGEAGDSDDS
ncbi:MAG: hypothetical protein GTO53_13245 [Planctomycetales bacterium]|nr:hypothetical protein [Planctomycetales bacterium]NIN09501.1 hypothetical protein [Planctomycetales bacterium]NIN78612.1 hypothetical protein [Planctomycetales bacterium]NIO35806.1 hypothetical protein [Planctomycetales bacterium]NIO47557.1 hypothetical protein [Planctomycetales bacterium]